MKYINKKKKLHKTTDAVIQNFLSATPHFTTHLKKSFMTT